MCTVGAVHVLCTRCSLCLLLAAAQEEHALVPAAAVQIPKNAKRAPVMTIAGGMPKKSRKH